MTNVENRKRLLIAIAPIITVLAVSTIGNGGMALAETTTITKNTNNTGVNVQTDTNQKQDCLTAGGSSGISGSCIASSTDKIDQSGGMLTSSRMPSSTSSSVSPPVG